MTQETYILPVRCARCDALFDLWYDLNKQGGSSGDEFESYLNQYLCWGCREAALKKFREKKRLNESFENEESESDFLIDFE